VIEEIALSKSSQVSKVRVIIHHHRIPSYPSKASNKQSLSKKNNLETYRVLHNKVYLGILRNNEINRHR
jgi:hypothetical protein